MPADFRVDARILIALAGGREIQDGSVRDNDPNRELGAALKFDRLVSMASLSLEIPFYLEEVGLPVKTAKESVQVVTASTMTLAQATQESQR